jgi:glucan 1,3-beta-glucosidase
MAILSLSALLGALQLFSTVVQSAPISSSSNDTQLIAATSFWLPQIQKQGVAAFGKPGYVVYRNVKDYGAKGDGKWCHRSCDLTSTLRTIADIIQA